MGTLTECAVLVACVFVLVTKIGAQTEPREVTVLCYYTNWSVRRSGAGYYPTTNIDPFLCTHVLYAFGGITKESVIRPSDRVQDIDNNGFITFTGLKDLNPNLKTIFAIGGTDEGSATFSAIGKDEEKRKKLIRNMIKFLRDYNFDGLDFDWGQPSFGRGADSEDRDNYATLVQEFKEAFEMEETDRPRLLVSITLPRERVKIERGYDLPKISRYADWMSIRGYDYHSALEPVVNHHAPLFSVETDADSTLNLDYTVQYYIREGVDRAKIMLGIPTYGCSYTLQDPNVFAIGSNASGPGEKGPFTGERGVFAYYEICANVMPKNDSMEQPDQWTVVQPNSRAMGPFAHKGDQWVGYEDMGSVERKAEYAADQGLGGIMFWSIELDDFQGTCHGRQYPLINAGKDALTRRLRGAAAPSPTSAPSPQTEATMDAIVNPGRSLGVSMDNQEIGSPTLPSSRIANSAPREARVLCYYTNWSQMRPGIGYYPTRYVDPNLCTHVIYAFGGISKESLLRPSDKAQDIDNYGFITFTGLKMFNPNLKTILAVGGTDEGSNTFSFIAADKSRRTDFIKNAIKFLRDYNFDGLDLDWGQPGLGRGAGPEDKANYATLVQELREEFDADGAEDRPSLLLSVTLPREKAKIETGYDLPQLTKYVDWMSIRGYDYHMAIEPVVNHHAPLYSADPSNDDNLNTNYTTQYYISEGVDRDKLMLGMPTYGRSFTLENPDSHGIGSKAIAPGDRGVATGERGVLAYYEICANLVPRNDSMGRPVQWTVVQPNPGVMGPYAHKGNQWVAYDDVESVARKAEYVAEQGLGGIMFWAMDMDDFQGTCHGRTYPLIKAAKDALRRSLGLTTDTATTEGIPSPAAGFRTTQTTSLRPTTQPTTIQPTQPTTISTSTTSTTQPTTIPPTQPTTQPTTISTTAISTTQPTTIPPTQPTPISTTTTSTTQPTTIPPTQSTMTYIQQPIRPVFPVQRESPTTSATPLRKSVFKSPSAENAIDDPEDLKHVFESLLKSEDGTEMLKKYLEERLGLEESTIRRILKKDASTQPPRMTFKPTARDRPQFRVPTLKSPSLSLPVGRPNYQMPKYPSTESSESMDYNSKKTTKNRAYIDYGSSDDGLPNDQYDDDENPPLDSNSNRYPLSISSTSKVSLRSSNRNRSPISYSSNVDIDLPEDQDISPLSFSSGLSFTYYDESKSDPKNSQSSNESDGPSANISANNTVSVRGKDKRGKVKNLSVTSNTSASLARGQKHRNVVSHSSNDDSDSDSVVVVNEDFKNEQHRRQRQGSTPSIDVELLKSVFG